MQAPIQLGCSVEEAFAGPQELAAAQKSLGKHGFAVWYRPEQSRVLVILRQGVGQQQILHGAFAAHVFLHMLRESKMVLCQPELTSSPAAAPPHVPQCSLAEQPQRQRKGIDVASRVQRQQSAYRDVMLGNPTSMVQMASEASEDLYPEFLQLAQQQGWQLEATMLNTKDVRLCMP